MYFLMYAIGLLLLVPHRIDSSALRYQVPHHQLPLYLENDLSHTVHLTQVTPNYCVCRQEAAPGDIRRMYGLKKQRWYSRLMQRLGKQRPIHYVEIGSLGELYKIKIEQQKSRRKAYSVKDNVAHHNPVRVLKLSELLAQGTAYTSKIKAGYLASFPHGATIYKR